MAELAELEEKQKAAGLLTEDAAPIRLALDAMVPKEPREEKKPDIAPPKPRPGIAFGGDDDDEEESERKKKRTLVRLEYEGDGLSEAEKVAQRNAKLLEIRRDIPKDRRSLFAMAVQWAAIPEVSTRHALWPQRVRAERVAGATLRQDHAFRPGEDEGSPRRGRPGSRRFRQRAHEGKEERERASGGFGAGTSDPQHWSASLTPRSRSSPKKPPTLSSRSGVNSLSRVLLGLRASRRGRSWRETRWGQGGGMS